MRSQEANIGAADQLGLHGIVPPTITVFDDADELDLEATAAHAEFVVDGGVDGVFPLGTNGEAPLLTAQERAAVIETVVDAVRDDVPVIAGVGVESTHETVRNSRAAADAGADGVVAVTPYYFPLDGAGAIEHYETVADATELPTYVYHIPSKTGNELSLDTLDAISAIDGIAGVKDSSKNIPWLGQTIDRNPSLTFLGGSDSLLYTSLNVGCSGVVSAIANVFPELVVELYDAYTAGDDDRARAIQSELFEVREALKQGPYLSGVKAALSLREDLRFDPGTTRAPLQSMTAADRQQLADRLDTIGLR